MKPFVYNRRGTFTVSSGTSNNSETWNIIPITNGRLTSIQVSFFAYYAGTGVGLTNMMLRFRVTIGSDGVFRNTGATLTNDAALSLQAGLVLTNNLGYNFRAGETIVCVGTAHNISSLAADGTMIVGITLKGYAVTDGIGDNLL